MTASAPAAAAAAAAVAALTLLRAFLKCSVFVVVVSDSVHGFLHNISLWILYRMAFCDYLAVVFVLFSVSCQRAQNKNP